MIAPPNITPDRRFGDASAPLLGEVAGIPVAPIALLAIAGVAFLVLWKKLGKS